MYLILLDILFRARFLTEGPHIEVSIVIIDYGEVLTVAGLLNLLELDVPSCDGLLEGELIALQVVLLHKVS